MIKTTNCGQTALVVEGGAMRGVFTTGVLDGFLKAGFNPFDFHIGVSSGASNLAAFLAEMPGRNFRIYTDYSLRPEFIDFKRFLRGGHLMDLDWMWDITIKEVRLNLRKIQSSGKPFFVCLTDVKTGLSVYWKTEESDLEAALKASSALPVIYRGFPNLYGRSFADGGISDPLPVKAACGMGARKIMVIRSRPASYFKKESLLQTILLFHLRKYPHLKKAFESRVIKYNNSVMFLRTPPAGLSVVEICPPENFRQTRLGREKKLLTESYELGKRMAAEAMDRWHDL